MRLLVAAGLTAAALTGVTPPAAADNPLCPADNICVHKNANYSGGRYILLNTTYGYLRLSLHSYDTGGSVDNSTSSVINNSDYRLDSATTGTSPATARSSRCSPIPRSAI